MEEQKQKKAEDTMKVVVIIVLVVMVVGVVGYYLAASKESRVSTQLNRGMIQKPKPIENKDLVENEDLMGNEEGLVPLVEGVPIDSDSGEFIEDEK